MIEENKIKLCFIGNPNVGKSTLINRLLNSNELKTSEIPGTTIKTIEKKYMWKKKEFIFFDTAGVYRKKNFNFNLLIKATKSSQIIILILDSTIEKLDKLHKKLASYALKIGKGLLIIYNKWDLVKNKKSKRIELEKFVKFSLPQVDHKKILFISALRDTTFTRIFNLSIQIKALLNKKISTSNLNKWLRETVKINPPIRIKGKEIKFKYATQVDIDPPTFKIFSNHPKKIKLSYKKFLENKLKTNYNLNNVPVVLKFPESKNPYNYIKK
tara:strand:- start:6188 stop:6997 length:810 start_codon:yes stop_codon:yes gene_type:complete